MAHDYIATLYGKRFFSHVLSRFGNKRKMHSENRLLPEGEAQKIEVRMQKCEEPNACGKLFAKIKVNIKMTIEMIVREKTSVSLERKSGSPH